MVSIFHRAAPSQMLVREAPGVARLLTRDPISLRGLSLAFAIVVVSPLSAARAQAIPAAGAGGEQRHTQLEPGSRSLDSLVAHALEVNPAIHAAAARVKAAGARVGPAGARPDPMFMAGVQNYTLGVLAFSDFMTMKMIGISQTFPFPGKLSFQTRAATDEVRAARAALDAARLDVAARVKEAYYDLAFADRALDIVRRNQTVLTNLISVSEARYTTGMGTQADVLRARTETANLENAASAIEEHRRAALARLNAVLDRPSDTPVESPVIPMRIARAAVADSAAQVHFASGALGARAADSPLLPLDSLQALAVANSPMVEEHVARIAAQRARVALARKAHLPDVSVSLDYAQRQGFHDMVSATISVPIPLQKGRKQDAEVAEAVADLTALEAEHHQLVNTLNADVARQVSDLERARTALALAKRAILPQAQATLASSTASYQVGRLDFAAVMDAQASVFNTETTYYQSLTDFATSLAELERTVGAEVLR